MEKAVKLSKVQLMLLGYVEQGLTTMQILDKTGFSRPGFNYHRKAILTKTCARDLQHAARMMAAYIGD